MKEISLKMLDELAKKMPVIDETDQERYAGGTYYIDYGGGDFGQVGSGDRLSLLGTQQMYNYAVANKLEDYGVYLFEATDDFFKPGSVYHGQHIQKKVFANYARQVINYEGEVSVVNDWYKDDLYYVRSQSAGVSGSLCFNQAKSGMIFCNEGLIQRLIQVQKDIHLGPVYPGGEDPNDPGRDPRIAVIMDAIQEMNKLEDYVLKVEKNEEKHKYMHNASIPSRMVYASELYSIWHEQGKAGVDYEIWNAYKICGTDPVP